MKEWDQLGPAIFAGVMFALGAVFAGWALSRVWLAWRSAKWPSAVGTILRAEIVEGRDMDGDKTFTRLVEYEFEVAGQIWRGTTVEFDVGEPLYLRREQAERQLAGLKAGRQVTVRFSPANPQQCALSTVTTRSLAASLLFGVSWVALSGWYLAELLVR